MRWLLLALLAAGCAPEIPSERHTLNGELTEPTPRRAGDPLRVEFTVERTVDGVLTPLCAEPRSAWCNVSLRDAQPLLSGPSGLTVATTELLDVDGEFTDWAVPPGPPGVYTVTGAAGVAMPFSTGVAFRVEDWGQATDFDDEAVVGKAFSLADYATRPFDVSGLLAEQTPVFAQIDASDGTEASFRMLTELEGETCVVLAATGVWEGSELVYAEDRLAVEHPELGELVAEDVFLSLAFRSGDLDFADGRLDLIVDTRPFDSLLDQDNPGSGDACDLLEAVGALCEPCEDAEPECVSAHAYKGEFRALESSFGTDVPFCGIDAVNAPSIPSFSCDLDPDVSCDVGCSSAGRSFAPLGLFFVPWLMRRRRR
ncbi:MAG: hypothetical protein KC912_09545 [Proteobacteria bacterium]|nr:hypothetical protein [Pseudomonadota bacterium]